MSKSNQLTEFSVDSDSRIAIVGAGVSGLTAAFYLRQLTSCTVHLFEAQDRLGGHAHTHTLEFPAEPAFAVDTGFIVFNDRNYPNFRALLGQLGVDSHATDMSFSVSIAHEKRRGAFEYNGGDWRGLFAQRSNCFRPSFWRLLRDIVRFNRRAKDALRAGEGADQSIGDWLREHRFEGPVVARYLLPMSGAIWSTSPRRILDFPIRSMFHFLDNHGLLDLSDRPQWQSLRGGSTTYVQALQQQLDSTVEVGNAVTGVVPTDQGVDVLAQDGSRHSFDAVLMACHADDALGLIQGADELEHTILGAFRYSQNRTYLHSDASLMPMRRAAWASWNYVGAGQEEDQPIAVSYWMNHLQELETERLMVVTLNPQRTPAHVHRELTYRHPQFDLAAREAQGRRADLQGHRRLWYAGAHWRWGFHEDGVRSALEALRSMGVPAPLHGEMEAR